MPRLAPFDALTFDPSVVGPLETVTAPPYDVISEARRARFLEVPHSIVGIDLPEGPVDGPGNRYERAARTLDAWTSSGALRRRPTGYHAYEMAHSGGRVRGLFCAMTLEAWGGSVIPHERTMTGPLEDRLRLLRATQTHLSAIYGTIAGPSAPLANLLDGVAVDPPELEIRDEQGVLHRLWGVPADTPVDEWLADEPLLIADGHHRYTTALRYRDERRASDGPGAWDRLLTLVVDAGTQDVSVLPFHRIQLEGVAPVDGVPLADLTRALEAVSDEAVVVATVTREPRGLRFRSLHLPGEAPAVRALHDAFLDRAVRPAGLRYTPDAEEAVQAVRDGAVAAYLLPPTTPDRIRKAIGRGQRLPQKSTFFWPKPRTGVVLMPLGPVPSLTPPR